MAGVRIQAHLGLVAVASGEQPLGAVVVLDVACPGMGNRRDRLHLLERLRSLELGQDRLHGAAQVVGQHAQPPPVRHPEHDLLRAASPSQRDQLVDHRDHRVEALDREQLLAQIGLLEEALELEHLHEPGEQGALLVHPERSAMRSRLDHLPQPHALLVRGEVLDLVGDRAAVRLAHPWQDIEQRLALDPACAESRRDLRHQLGGQIEVLGLDRGIALRLGAERVEAGRQVPVGAVGLEQRGCGLHRLEQLAVGRCWGRGRGGHGARGQRRRRGRRRVGVGGHGGGDSSASAIDS